MIAGWWAAAGEVREDGQRLGWSEADVETAAFAWLEAKRPAIQLLPNVAVPGKHPESEAPTPLQRALPGGAALSTRELVPTVSLVHPGNERYRPPLHKFFFELGEEQLAAWSRTSSASRRYSENVPTTCLFSMRL